MVYYILLILEVLEYFIGVYFWSNALHPSDLKYIIVCKMLRLKKNISLNMQVMTSDGITLKGKKALNDEDKY